MNSTKISTIKNIKSSIIMIILLKIYKLFADMEEKQYLCAVIL